MDCEEKNALARRLMNALRQKTDLIAREGSMRELMAVRADLAERNVRLTQHSLICSAR